MTSLMRWCPCTRWRFGDPIDVGKLDVISAFLLVRNWSSSRHWIRRSCIFLVSESLLWGSWEIWVLPTPLLSSITELFSSYQCTSRIGHHKCLLYYWLHILCCDSKISWVLSCEAVGAQLKHWLYNASQTTDWACSGLKTNPLDTV